MLVASDFIGVKELAKRLRLSRHFTSNLFQRGVLNPDRTTVISGRRLIPVDYLPEIERILTERGIIKEVPAC